MVTFVEAPKNAEFVSKRRGAAAKTADPKLVTLLESGNKVYIRKADFTGSARNEFTRAAASVAVRDGKQLKVKTLTGELSGESVVQVWGAWEDVPVEAEATEDAPADTETDTPAGAHAAK